MDRLLALTSEEPNLPMNITIASLKGAEATGLRIFSVGGFLLASLGVCAAEEIQLVEGKPVKEETVTGNLAPTTIMANRIESNLSMVGSSVTVLDVGMLDEQGIRNLDDVLKFVPGVVSESLGGQRGSSSSLFIRGTKTNHTHLVVDGMRISDSNMAMGSFLGSSNLNGFSRIEILRGPQGALYGGDSIGGVMGVYSAKGEGDFSGQLRLEGGSFNSWNTMLGVQGEEGDFSYSLSLGYESTDNDLPNNGFDMFSYALRLDYAVNACLNVGFTLRGADTNFQAPSYGSSSPLNDDLAYTLGTIFAEYEVSDQWSTKLTLGMYDQEYDNVTEAFGWNPAGTYNTDASKLAMYWDNTLEWNEQHTTVTGAVYENSDFSYKSTGWGLSQDDRTRDQYGLYVNHIWDVTENFNLTGGARWEDYDDYGDEVTWRVSSAYTVSQTDTTFRGSVGKGFRPPSFVDLYGFGGQAPSPDLEAETSLGWDLGVEQSLCDGQYVIGLTYFGNRIEDSITYVYVPFPGNSYNENADGVTETSGLEASAEAHFLDDRLSVKASYTWLDRALVDMPEHSFGLRIHGDVSDQLGVGLTASYFDDRAFFGEEVDAYALVNLYGNYEVTENITLNARVDNLFNEDYDYASGFGNVYPGRGTGIFGGVTLSW